jgi:hypothetical protein
MVIDEKYGWENFRKLSSNKKGEMMQEASKEALLARNKGELHLP